MTVHERRIQVVTEFVEVIAIEAGLIILWVVV